MSASPQLGSFFFRMTVATVIRDRTVERLDRAATTVRTAIGVACRQPRNAGRDPYCLADPDDLARSAVSDAVPDGQLDQAAAAPGGPQPPWQGRGR
jgi:two-component system, cell cycle response regulator